MIVDHVHECRDCGLDIPCRDRDEDCQWPGSNAGCQTPECKEDQQ